MLHGCLLLLSLHILQTEKSPYQYRGMFHALSTVFREEGFRALYRGWLPSVIGVVSPSLTQKFQVPNSLWYSGC
jgi:solute carrier family 25 (mitochondrial phosphate transporter), member 23/24/25/41